MIDGLKLTMTGEELCKLLDVRIHEHAERAERWTRESERSVDDQTEERPLLPEHMCENEAERHQWRGEVLEFVREHLEAGEVYRLGAADLEFGELLPEKPLWLKQDEYERETGMAFNLGRLAKEVGALTSSAYALASSRREDNEEEEAD